MREKGVVFFVSGSYLNRKELTMPTFVLAAKRTVSADQVLADPKAMLDANQLTAYTQRANGTERHLELCPLGSTRRDTAEWISERMEDGLSVAQVARELHASTSVVRRFLLALELTEAIEAGEYDELWAEANGFDVAIDPETEDRPEVLAMAAFAADTVACSPHSACAVHGDGTTIAADQDCPVGGDVVITVGLNS